MALRNVVTIGDELLGKVSRAVDSVDDRTLTLIDDLWDTMNAEDGVGIAAVQVGVLKRIAVVDIAMASEDEEKTENAKDKSKQAKKTKAEREAEAELAELNAKNIVSSVELINPEILEQSGSIDGLEGCLSVPGKNGKVDRPTYVKVGHLDRQGNEVITEAWGFFARAICHEIDHMDGVLFVDKARDIVDIE